MVAVQISAGASHLRRPEYLLTTLPLSVHREAAAESTLASMGLAVTTTPYDNYTFRPIKEATVRVAPDTSILHCALLCHEICQRGTRHRSGRL